MIETAVARWHDFLRGKLPGGLDELLANDVVFFSPVVFTPQRGKEITKLYLSAAAKAFGGSPDSASGPKVPESKFRYTKEMLSGHHAALEFEAHVASKYVNGIDIITCDDEGRITEFRVMIRPLQAVNAMHAQMKAILEAMQPSSEPPPPK